MRIADILHVSACRYPDKVALFEENGFSVTYRQLERDSEKLAVAFREQYGLVPGDHVAIWSPNSIRVVELMFAINMAGMVSDYYNLRWSKSAVDTLVSNFRPKLVVAGDRDLAAAIEGIPAPVVQMDGESESPTLWSYASQYDGENYIEAAMVDGAEAMNFFTSGTTGLPKCVEHTNRSIVMEILSSSITMGWRKDDTMIAGFPLYHAGGLSVLTSVLSGATSVLGTATKADQIARLVEKYHATRISTVPTVLERLLDYAEKNGAERLSSIRVVSYASAKLSPELVRRCREVLGCSFLQAYGMTETASSVICLNGEDHLHDELLGAVGKPMFGVHMRVVDDNGEECPQGVEGEVLLKSDTMMKGYKGLPGLTAHVFEGGWYHTHDSGFIDERGYLHLLGRRDDMIISGGENIFPSEVEECILRLSKDVKSVAVVGADDEKWGQCPVAFIVKADGSSLTEEQVRGHCAEGLGRFKRPKYVYFVDDLPRNALGKTMKGALLAMYEDRLRQSGASHADASQG